MPSKRTPRSLAGQGQKGDKGSLLAGSIVVGAALVFAGPFITVLAIVASIVYGISLTFHFIGLRMGKNDLQEWG